MTDLICRKSMMRCQTPGMCSPHGGCQDPVQLPTNEMVQLRISYAAALDKIDQMNADLNRATEREILQLAEIEALRKIVVECATVCGAAPLVEPSVSSMAQVPAEIASVIGTLRKAPDLQKLLPDIDEALEDLEIHGRHSDQGYRKLKEWYRKVGLACNAIDVVISKGERS